MNPIKNNILRGYAYAAWAQGYHAHDRNAIGMLLGVSDEDLDFICDVLSEWATLDDEEQEVHDNATDRC